MLRLYGSSLRSALLGGGIFAHFDRHDVHDKPITEEEEEEEEDQAWHRLKVMYSYDKYGSVSPQIALVSEGSSAAFILGFLLGGISQSRDAYVKWIEENKATAFDHIVDARRRLTDTVTVNMVKGGMKAGWRLGLLTGSLLLAITTINTYNGKTSIVEFILGSAGACGIYKIRDGPKPMISGSIVGGFMGAIAGGIILSVMKIAGVTFEDIYILDADRIQKHHEKYQEKMEVVRKKRYEAEKMYREGPTLATDKISVTPTQTESPKNELPSTQPTQQNDTTKS